MGSFLVGLYLRSTSIFITMAESMLAILLFYMTPKKWLKELASLVPGTLEYSQEEKLYLQKMRDVTTSRVEQFSDVFAALSKSFMSNEEKRLLDQSEETDILLSNVTEKVCQQCFMKNRCWKDKFDETYTLLDDVKTSLFESDQIDRKLWLKLKSHCVNHHDLKHTLKSELFKFQMNKRIKDQMNESKKIVAEQLKGVSDVMDHFAKEIVK